MIPAVRRCSATALRFHRLLSTASRQPAREAEFPKYTGPTQHYINNEFVSSLNGATMESINPGNGQVTAEIAEAGEAEVDMAVSAAEHAFTRGPWWNTMTGRERGACLYRLAELITEHKDQLAAVESLDNGKTISQAETVDAPACATILRYYAGWADKITGLHIPVGSGLLNYTRHEPVGVCGLIVPWNLPLIAIAAKIGPALCTGNTVVLKTAEATPLSGLLLCELIQKAGFPAGVVNIISGTGVKAGAPLVKHPLVNKVSFTGSVATGRMIQSMAADSIKRVTLELGGNNPLIVCKDADMPSTLQTVHNALFWNDGEACAAGSRIFVHEDVYDEVVEGSTALAKQRKVGNPFDRTSQQGAQVSEDQLNKVLGYIEGAKKDGAELMCGGERVGDEGFYLQPTVFADCTDNMKVFKEEVFGPVMTLTKFKDVGEVVQRANDTDYGLACGVFTKDAKVGNELMQRVRAGLMFWNCYHCADISAPFGGFKQSGLGREGGPYGLQAYLEIKNVVQSTQI